MQHTATTSTSYGPGSFPQALPMPAQQYGRPGFGTGNGQHPTTYTSDDSFIQPGGPVEYLPTPGYNGEPVQNSHQNSSVSLSLPI